MINVYIIHHILCIIIIYNLHFQFWKPCLCKECFTTFDLGSWLSEGSAVLRTLNMTSLGTECD